MKTKLFISVAMVGILIFAGACTAANANTTPKETTVEVTIDELMQQEHIEKQVTMVVGDTLTVKLGSNPTTGFSWGEQAQIGNQAILEQTGQEFIAPDNNALGAAGSQEWTFEAKEKGNTTVSMEYSRPWEGGEKGVWTFQLTVDIK